MVLLILRFILFSGLFFLFYKLLLARMSFFKLNRSVILIIPVISLAIPAIAPLFEAPVMVKPVLGMLLHEVNIGEQTVQSNTNMTGINWYLIFYLLGVTIMASSVIIGLVKGWGIVRRSVPAFENVRVSKEATGPFAFFQSIVIPADMLKASDIDPVIAHEKAHVEQRHGYDNLFFNFLCAAFWFNPFMHLLNRELRQVHECLADEAALQKTTRETYARLLLSHIFSTEISFDSANPFFNSSLIKSRITMIYKTKTNTKMKVIYLALLPLLAVMTIVSCQKTDQQQTSAPEVEKTQPLGFTEAERPPLFDQCDVEAPREEQVECFQHGIMHYIMENFKYPEKARKAGLEGKIFLNFVINTAGEVEQVDVVKNDFPEDADKEAVADAQVYAVKLITNLPKMLPAIKDGKKVAITLTLPINMKLS